MQPRKEQHNSANRIHSGRSKEVEFQIAQRVIRKIWGIEPCKRFELPRWLERHLFNLLPHKDLDRCWDEFTAPSFIDHWGVLPDGQTFIAEPYLGETTIADAIAHAQKYGLIVMWSAESWHYPGKTIRLQFELPTRAVVGS